MRLGGIGIWDWQLRYAEPAQVTDAAAELESLGYRALWIPDVGGDVFGALRTLLDATTHLTVATGILNLWMHTPAETATARAAMVADHPGRLLLGIGVSHAPLVDAQQQGTYRRPLARMREYLDALDAAQPPVPASERVLAALGPRMLELARDRAAGAHPYLVTPEHTHRAREALGDGPLLLPEQAVVLETDPQTARALGRAHLAGYITLPNYATNWYRLGFTEEDTANGGSDRLVDALVAWGDLDTVVRRVRAHLDAGADHVCLQVIRAEGEQMPRQAWRTLAEALTG